MNKLTKLPALCLLLVSGAAAATESSVAQGADPQQRQQRAEQWKARWDQADANHDGMLSRDEAQQAMPKLARRFDQLDANGNGQLTSEELRAAFQAGKERRQRPPHPAN
jgi:Ca2+-binding EF-hand superfamily protein